MPQDNGITDETPSFPFPQNHSFVKPPLEEKETAVFVLLHDLVDKT